MAIGYGPVKKPQASSPQPDAKRLVGDALVGQIKSELTGNSQVGAQNRAQVGRAVQGAGQALFPGPAATMGPPPASVNNGRPDFPTLGPPSPLGQDSMGPSPRPDLGLLGRSGQSGIGISQPGMAPETTPSFNPPVGPAAPAGLQARPDFPTFPLVSASGQPMIKGPGYVEPPPQGVQFGPPVPPNYDPQAPIRALQNAGVVGERVGQPGKGPGEMPPLAAALLGGQNPITGPSGPSMATAAGLMTDNQAYNNYRNSPADSKYMPGMTVGGRFGLNGPGVDPNSPDTLKRISDAQNVARLGNGREAVLAGLNRSGYKAPADKQHDFGLTNSGKFNEGGQRKEPYSPSEAARINDAKAKLNSPERQKYLADRKATVDARKAERAPAVQAKAMAKTESRRFRQGIMSNEDRLAFKDPTAAAQREVGKASVAQAGARDRATDATNRARIESGERTARNRDKAMVRAAKIKAIDNANVNDKPNPFGKSNGPGAGAPPVPGLPPNTPSGTHDAIRSAAAEGDVDGIRKALIGQGVTDKSKQKEIIAKATGDPAAGLSFWERPAFNGGGRPISRGEVVDNLKKWLFTPVGPTKNILFGDKK